MRSPTAVPTLGPVVVGVSLLLVMPEITRVPAESELAEWRHQIGLEVANLIGVEPHSVVADRFNVATGLASISLIGTRDAGSTVAMEQLFHARKVNFCTSLLVESVPRSVCYATAQPTAAPVGVLAASTTAAAASTSATAVGAAGESGNTVAGEDGLSKAELIVLITFAFVAVVVVSLAVSKRANQAASSTITNFTNTAFEAPSTPPPPLHASQGSPSFAQHQDPFSMGMPAVANPGPLYMGGGVGLSGRPAGMAAPDRRGGGLRFEGSTIAENWNNWGRLSASPQAPPTADLFVNNDQSLMSATATTP